MHAISNSKKVIHKDTLCISYIYEKCNKQPPQILNNVESRPYGLFS